MCIDIIYCRYLNYCTTSARQLRIFQNFIQNELSSEETCQNIYDYASTIEDPVDVVNDIEQLKLGLGIPVLHTYHSALIYSQLFNVTTTRHSAILYTLSEFSQLKRHNNSFVCYHDQGNIFISTSLYPLFTLNLTII